MESWRSYAEEAQEGWLEVADIRHTAAQTGRLAGSLPEYRRSGWVLGYRTVLPTVLEVREG